MLVVTHLTGFNAGGGAIAYVGGKVFAHTNGTTSVSLTDLTGGLASAPAAGDVVVVGTSIGTTTSGNIDMTCTGYTEVADLFGDDDLNANLGVFLKLMTSTPDTSITLNDPPVNNPMSGAISVWRGVNSTTIQDVAATTATGTNTVLADPPSITPATPGAIVVAIGAGAQAVGDVDFSSSDLSTFLPNAIAGTVSNSIGMGWIGPWAGGAVNPAAFTFGAGDGTAYSWAACCLALRPG